MMTAANSKPVKPVDTGRTSAGIVRAVAPDDIPTILRLYLMVYDERYRGREDTLQQNLSRIFLDNPWRSESLPSLLFEDNNGEAIGCLGVLPRPMLFNGQDKVMAAVTHSFMVKPGSRSSLAAIHLLRHFFAGPQDLSLGDTNPASSRLWESAGGAPSLLYGLCWTRLLKPSRNALRILGNLGLPPLANRVLSPISKGVDYLVPRFSDLFRFAQPDCRNEAFDARILETELPGFMRGRNLSPIYTAQSSAWLIGMLARNRRYGILHKRLVRNSKHDIIGWYLYFIKSSGIAEVAQLVATASSVDHVLDSLFYHATQHGAVVITGRVDPMLINALSNRNCTFRPIQDSWVMLHSRKPELLQTIHAGNAFLSPLESEWWISSILE